MFLTAATGRRSSRTSTASSTPTRRWTRSSTTSTTSSRSAARATRPATRCTPTPTSSSETRHSTQQLQLSSSIVCGGLHVQAAVVLAEDAVTSLVCYRAVKDEGVSESLKFNAQFESGNLRKVIQVYEYCCGFSPMSYRTRTCINKFQTKSNNIYYTRPCRCARASTT